MKKHFKISRSQLFQSDQKKAQKIERILKSYYTASFPAIIFGNWKASGIDISFENVFVSKIALNKNKAFVKLIKQLNFLSKSGFSILRPNFFHIYE